MNKERFDALMQFCEFCVKQDERGFAIDNNSEFGRAVSAIVSELGLDMALRQRIYKYKRSISAMTGNETAPISGEEFLRKHGQDVLGADIIHVNDRITHLDDELAQLYKIKDTIIRLQNETSEIIGVYNHCQKDYQDAIFDYNMKGGSK